MPFAGWMAFIWIMMTALGGILTGVQCGVGSTCDDNAESIVQILSFQKLLTKDIPFIPIQSPVPMPNAEFFDGIASLLTWQFPFWAGSAQLEMVRWFVWIPLTFMMGMYLVVNVGPLMIQALGLLGNFIAAVNPFRFLGRFVG